MRDAGLDVTSAPAPARHAPAASSATPAGTLAQASVEDVAAWLRTHPGQAGPLSQQLQPLRGNAFVASVLELARQAPLERSVDVGVGNDSLPMAEALVAPDRRSGGYGDDDGRTMSASLTTTITSPTTDEQLVFGTQYEMITQDGAAEDPSRSRRADVLTDFAQRNHRTEIGPGVSFYTGIGGGVQSVGDLGGSELQHLFHTTMPPPLSGRPLGGGLQDDYAGHGAQVMPVVTGGLGVAYRSTEVDGWSTSAGASLAETLPLGVDGLATAQARGDVGLSLRDAFTLSGAVTYSIAAPTGGYLDFAPVGEGLLGAELRLQVDLLRRVGFDVSPYVSLQTNGAGFADTTYSIGVVVHDGAAPWLAPPR